MESELITSRENELRAKQTRLQEQMLGIERELAELEVAKAVLARLSGKKQVSPVVAAPPAKKSTRAGQKKPGGLPTIKEMVLAALMDARQRNAPGLAPKDIRNFASSRYNFEMGSSANTVPSRMWRDEKIIRKDTETGLFSLPSKEKPADDTTVESPSTGLFSNLAKGREAGPGGGP
jgi:hypothetical protein